MWIFIVDVVHDFVSSLQPDVGRGFLHVSNVFLLLGEFINVIIPHVLNILTKKKLIKPVASMKMKLKVLSP